MESLENHLRQLRRLEPPAGKVDLVMDTDTYNEVDDQFAVVYALMAPEKINLEAIYAAPFFNSRSTGPEDGMEKSYVEIHQLLERMKIRRDRFVFRGSRTYLPDCRTPVESPAVDDLIRRAMDPARTAPLYVAAIGAITNIASALIKCPALVDRIVLIWLGGQPYNLPSANEFNLMQDVPAAQVVFDSGVPLIHIPCGNVAEHLRTSLSELELYVKGRGAIGDYLYQTVFGYSSDHFAWTKVIWDIATIAWLINPAWLPTEVVHAPHLAPDMTWGFDHHRHFIRVCTHADRDAVFRDLFTRLDGSLKENIPSKRVSGEKPRKL